MEEEDNIIVKWAQEDVETSYNLLNNNLCVKGIPEFEPTNATLQRPSDISTENQQFSIYVLLYSSHRVKQIDIIAFVTNKHGNTFN